MSHEILTHSPGGAALTREGEGKEIWTIEKKIIRVVIFPPRDHTFPIPLFTNYLIEEKKGSEKENLDEGKLNQMSQPTRPLR